MAQSETDKILSEAGYAPPKDSAAKGSTGASKAKADTPPADDKPKTRTPKWRKMESQVAELYGMAAMGLQTTGNELEAHIIAQSAEQLASGWIDLAENNPSVARVIEKLTQGGQWGNVIMGHVMIALPILAHRGIGPEPLVKNFRMMNTLQYGVQYPEPDAPAPGLFDSTENGGSRVGQH